MKKQLLYVFIVLLVFNQTERICAKANVSNGRAVTIGMKTADVTGDGNMDKIVLIGVKMKNGMYKNLAINIYDATTSRLKIDLPKGFKPSINLVDINGDGVKDLYTSLNTSKNSTYRLHSVYTAKNSKAFQLNLPESLIIESHFLNGYKAKIKIRNTGISYNFDLQKRKNFYERSGVFYNGKLNEPTELMVAGRFNNLRPVQIGGKYGLEGTQNISGVTDSDKLGVVESTWLHEQIGWQLLNVKVFQKN